MNQSRLETGTKRLGKIGLASFVPCLMNRTMGRCNASSRGEMADPGLSTPKMRALTVPTGIEGPLIRELAVCAVAEQSTLSRAPDRLAAEGLIRRETDADDSRGTRVFITCTGRAAFATLWPRRAAVCARLFRGGAADERRVFGGPLQQMLTNIRRHEFKGAAWNRGAGRQRQKRAFHTPSPIVLGPMADKGRPLWDFSPR